MKSVGWHIALVAGHPDGYTWPAPVTDDDVEAIQVAETQDHRVVVAVGANDARWRLHNMVAPQWRARPLVASTATVAEDATLGAGTVVLHHAHVGPASRVGEAAIVNTSAVVEHDCTIGDAVHIAPGAVVLGGTTIGDRTLLGSRACVLPGIRIGVDATVGAGAVVTENVPDGVTVVGIPARPIGEPDV
jgi:sugar O-acyltransferase (sialic acid O-acetyltransferase NeuD family)